MLVKCYVCNKNVKIDDAVYIGKQLYRHHSCCPGTIKWLKSDIGRKSEMKRYFTVINKDKINS